MFIVRGIVCLGVENLWMIVCSIDTYDIFHQLYEVHL